MKDMKKGQAWIVLLCLVLLLAGITYIDLFGVDASGTGSASDIKLGLDLAGGVSITYQVVGEETPDSDVDILVVFDRENHSVGLLDHVRMINSLEDLLQRRIDLVEDGTLLPFALESANNDKLLFYERAS